MTDWFHRNRMNNKDIFLQQQQLLVRSERLRNTISDQTQVFKRPFAIIDIVLASVNWLKQHPKWPLGAVVVLVVLRPRKSILWGSRLWGAWKTYKRLKSQLEKRLASN